MYRLVALGADRLRQLPHRHVARGAEFAHRESDYCAAKEFTMEITITQTGGIVGLLKLGPVDTETLPENTARRLNDIITGMDFFNLPADITRDDGANVPSYETTVVDHNRTHTVRSNENSPISYTKQLGELIGLVEGLRSET
jgi:hypothetical protein